MSQTSLPADEALPQEILSQQILQKQMNQLAPIIKQLNFIIKEVSARMLDRLDYIKINPKQVLDIGFGLGVDKYGLVQRYPKAQVSSIDFALNILQHYSRKSGWFNKKHKDLICADARNLPIAAQSMDLVWSNLTLPYIMDIQQYFAEINRVLKLGATFLVSGLGVDSLKELRALGLGSYNFPDMHRIGDTLVELGFSNPVTDLEYITLEYDKLADLLADLRAIGCGGISLGQNLSEARYKNLQAKFAELCTNGKFPLTLEIFYAHAWKDKIRSNLVSGRSVIQFHPTTHK